MSIRIRIFFILYQNDTQSNEFNNQDMLKEGVITQEEYDNIKKKYLKDIK